MTRWHLIQTPPKELFLGCLYRKSVGWLGNQPPYVGQYCLYGVHFHLDRCEISYYKLVINHVQHVLLHICQLSVMNIFIWNSFVKLSKVFSFIKTLEVEEN